MGNDALLGLTVLATIALCVLWYAAWHLGYGRGHWDGCESMRKAIAPPAVYYGKQPAADVTDWPLEIGECFNYLGVSMVCVGRTRAPATSMAPAMMFPGITLQDVFTAEYTCRDGIVRQAIFRREMWPVLRTAGSSQPTTTEA